MHCGKENKPNNDVKSSSLSYEKCQDNINILESIIEYIKNIEKALKEIMQENLELKNKFPKNDDNNNYNTTSELNNENILKIYSQGKNHIEGIEKIINDFKKSMKNEDSVNIKEDGLDNKNGNHNNNLEFAEEIEEIKNYYEGKMLIMDKKIKVFEILENLYIKQVDELKKKLNKNITHRIKKINEDLIVYDFH